MYRGHGVDTAPVLVVLQRRRRYCRGIEVLPIKGKLVLQEFLKGGEYPFNIAFSLQSDKFLVISMLLCVSVPVQRDDTFVERLTSCLRPHSAVVRQLVFKLWRPIFVSHGLQVPNECPLHILRDVYHPHVLETSTYRYR